MATQVENDSEVGVASLMGGIVKDAQQLIVEQLTLFQVEIKNEMRQAITALAPLVLGAILMLPGIILLGIGAAHLLAWAIPDMPLWLAFVLSGGFIILVGALLILWAKSILAKVSLIPDTALKGLKENIQWKTKN